MNTTNLISTPNIEGNIGSCAVQSNEVKVGNTFFTGEYQAVQINSCSGEVISTNQYTTYGGVWLAVLMAMFFLGVWASFSSSSNSY